ncbi:hypothetical protein ACO1O0_007762 [Amphichorda felina]
MTLTRLPATFSISPLPTGLTAAVTKLPAPDHRILLKKRRWLRTYSVLAPRDLERNGVPNPADATLVFAQEEAGTAVCVSPNGVLLTCSHCVAETLEDLDWAKIHWLLFASGEVVAARTVAWDGRCDLAVLVVVKATGNTTQASFPSIRLSPAAPKPQARLLCVGHPGSEDLEASIPGAQTNYDTLVLSAGIFRGLAPGQDPQDNSEIGALMHTCWTYWGHSGAPLVDRKTGALVGVHSSWDDETAMRRGVAWEALNEFLESLEKDITAGAAGAATETGTGTGVPEGWVWFTK